MLTIAKLIALLCGVVLLAQCAATRRPGNLPAPLQDELTGSRGVFVVPMNPIGKSKPPRESWFVYQSGVLYVPSAANDPRVRNIQKGQAHAIISITKADGSSFTATGKIVTDPKIYESVFAGMQSKYPVLWQQYGGRFRTGLRQSTHVLLQYTPVDS